MTLQPRRSNLLLSDYTTPTSKMHDSKAVLLHRSSALLGLAYTSRAYRSRYMYDSVHVMDLNAVHSAAAGIFDAVDLQLCTGLPRSRWL